MHKNGQWAFPGPAVVVGLVVVLLLAGCSSRPKKYRKARPCNCPTWGQVDVPAVKSEEGKIQAVVTPYYCGAERHS